MRCDATRFTQKTGCVAMMISDACTRLKKTRGPGAGNTVGRADPPSELRPRKGGYVKLMASLYAFIGGLAVATPARYVRHLTVTSAATW